MYKKEADNLHSIVENILWASKRGRHAIEPAILFLCTKVTKRTVENKAKSKPVLQLLKQKINDERVMVEDKLSQL